MCCCMSTYTIMIVDQCVVVCQPTPSWLGISVLLYVNLHHHDWGSVCCCMSTYTIMIGDQCVVVCQQVQYKFLDEVIATISHSDCRLVCCCMLTGAVQVPSRGHSRGLHQSWHQTDLGTAGQRVSYRHWCQQTQQEDRRRIQGIGRTLLFVHMEEQRDCVHHAIKRLSLHAEQSCFFLLSKQINMEINRSLVWRFGAASIITCW